MIIKAVDRMTREWLYTDWNNFVRHQGLAFAASCRGKGCKPNTSEDLVTLSAVTQYEPWNSQKNFALKISIAIFVFILVSDLCKVRVELQAADQELSGTYRAQDGK